MKNILIRFCSIQGMFFNTSLTDYGYPEQMSYKKATWVVITTYRKVMIARNYVNTPPLQQSSIKLLESKWAGDTNNLYQLWFVGEIARPNTLKVDEPTPEQMEGPSNYMNWYLYIPNLERKNGLPEVVCRTKQVVLMTEACQCRTMHQRINVEGVSKTNGATLRYYQQQLVDSRSNRTCRIICWYGGLVRPLATCNHQRVVFKRRVITRKTILVVAPKMVALDTWSRKLKVRYDIDVLINIGLARSDDACSARLSQTHHSHHQSETIGAYQKAFRTS